MAHCAALSEKKNPHSEFSSTMKTFDLVNPFSHIIKHLVESGLFHDLSRRLQGNHRVNAHVVIYLHIFSLKDRTPASSDFTHINADDVISVQI